MEENLGLKTHMKLRSLFQEKAEKLCEFRTLEMHND